MLFACKFVALKFCLSYCSFYRVQRVAAVKLPLLFVFSICETVHAPLSTYCKSLNTSRASNTSQGSDLIVLIEAGPWIEAGPQIQAGFHKLVQLVSLLSRRLCTVFWAKHMVIGLTCCLPPVCGNADVLGPSRASNRSRASITSWIFYSRGLLFKDLLFLFFFCFRCHVLIDVRTYLLSVVWPVWCVTGLDSLLIRVHEIVQLYKGHVLTDHLVCWIFKPLIYHRWRDNRFRNNSIQRPVLLIDKLEIVNSSFWQKCKYFLRLLNHVHFLKIHGTVTLTKLLFFISSHRLWQPLTLL